MFQIKHICFLFCFVFLTFPNSAKAQTAATFCNEIKNSNDLVKCLDGYYEKTKTSLAATFQQKLDSVDKANGQKLRDAQKSWIAYRDSQCEWEAENEKTESLKRVTQLYCLVRITEVRDNILSVALENLQEKQKFHGVTPRWENVLAEDFKDIFWRKNANIQSDINCNGRRANTVVGVRLGKNKTPQYVIGFVEGSSTGRPTATLFDLPENEEIADGEPARQCGDAILIQFTPANPKEECKQSEIVIQNGECASQMIMWDGKQFMVVKEVSDTQKNEAMQ